MDKTWLQTNPTFDGSQARTVYPIPQVGEMRLGELLSVGHSSSCFYMVKRWVEKKVRQQLMRARGRKSFGWKRWSSE